MRPIHHITLIVVILVALSFGRTAVALLMELRGVQ